MNDQDHNERKGPVEGQAAPQAPDAPQRKEPGEFTRRFLGGDATPAPGTPEPVQEAQPSVTNPAAGPGEFTKMFGGAGSSAPAGEPAAPKVKPNPPQARQDDAFARRFGGSDVQLSEDPLPGVKPKSEPLAEPSAASAPGTAPATFPSATSGFPSELKGPVKAEPAPRRQESLAEAFRHPLAPEDSMNLRSGMPQEESPGNADSPSGFTKLFSEAPAPKQRPAPSNTINFPEPQQRPSGPSDFTRVVSNRGKAAPGPAQPAAPPSAGTPSPAFQMPSPVLPSIPTPPSPPMPAAYPPQVHVQYNMPAPPAVPSMPQAPSVPAPQVTMPSAQTEQGSKWVRYLPVLIVMNVLFILAVVVILYFGLKK